MVIVYAKNKLFFHKVKNQNNLQVSKMDTIILIKVSGLGTTLYYGKDLLFLVFTSPVFLFLFLPMVIIFCFLMQKRYRNYFLLLASSAFYFYGEQRLILIMYGVILLNFITGLGFEYLEKRCVSSNFIQQHYLQLRKALLLLCIGICIGLLWYFKYWQYTHHIVAKLISALHIDYKLSAVDKIVLPLGISFYIFHCLSYTLDVYMGKLKAEKNLANFMTYVLMFPQLVAGPIVRYIDIQKQFIERSVSMVGFANGIRRFCFGLAKKVIIANTVAKVADQIFALPTNELSVGVAWLGAICYTLQIYFDFSGYSDMAIGLAALFGFHYKENFNYPYISKTISEFWRRWHISLSTWLRDYVYINLGGNRVTKWRYYLNLLLVFLLSGLWHGANTTFVLWGVWYGIFIIMESVWLNKFLKGKEFFAHSYALLVIIFGWVMFRADTVAYAIRYWGVMLGIGGSSFNDLAFYLQKDIIAALFIGFILSYDWRPLYKRLVIAQRAQNFRNRFFMFKLASYMVACLLFVVSVIIVISSSYNPFIYFRF